MNSKLPTAFLAALLLSVSVEALAHDDHSAPPPPDLTALKKTIAANGWTTGKPRGPKPTKNLALATQPRMPLTPSDIANLREQLENSKIAATAPLVGKQPQLTSHSHTVSFESGAQTYNAELSADYITTLVFTDRTGTPWPVSAVTSGRAEAITAEIAVEGSNIVNLSPTEEFRFSNVSVILKGAPAPIVISVVIGKEKVGFRLDYIVDAKGPNAKPDILLDPMPLTANATLMAFLDNIPPAGAERLVLRGIPGRAWQLGDAYFVRTEAEILSPAWTGSLRGAGGIGIYQLPEMPGLIAAHAGQVRNVTLHRATGLEKQ